MYACICRAVTERTVSAAIAAGACSLDDLAAGCGAGSGCGACLPSLHRLLQECLGFASTGAAPGPTPPRGDTCEEALRSSRS